MSSRYYGGFGGMVTPGVKGLMVANGGVFLLQMLFDRQMVALFGLTPELFWSHRTIWQPLTYMFLHGSMMHIFFNMLALWMFGGALESFWGTSFFLRFYFITGVGAGLCNTFLTPDSGAAIIGASGAVYGLLAAYGLLFPDSLIYIWMLVPVRAKYVVIVFGAIEFFSSIRPGQSPVAHLVHLGGMLIGVFYLRWHYILLWFKRKSRSVETFANSSKSRPSEAETLRREVDELLDKIHEVGIGNLTSWERRRLRDATERLKEIENRSI